MFFQHYGQGGLTSTDKIDVENIRYVKQTAAADMKDKLQVHTVKVTTVSVGQTYVLKVLVRNFIGQGANDYVYRYGTYKAKTGDDAAAIAKGLAENLQKSQGLVGDASDINNYKEKLFTVTYSGDTITIGEVEQYWSLPKFPVQQCPVEIYLNGIVTDDEIESYDWAKIGKGDPVTVNNVGKKMAELEYFAHGWRGDFYREKNYPYNLDTKYMVNPETSYDTIDIHYFFRGQGVSSQLSEKEITLIVTSANAAAVLAAIKTMMGTNKICAPEDYKPAE